MGKIALLFSLFAAIFIFQARSDNPNFRRDDLSDLRNDELVIAINKFIKGLDLERVIRDLFSLNQGQLLMKFNQIRSALNFDKEELGMVLGRIAESIETYSLDDLANLSEDDMVSIFERVVNFFRTYQDLIVGKIFAVSDSLGEDKNEAFDRMQDVGDIMNILSRSGQIKETVAANKDEITAVINATVKFIKLYNLEPVIKSFIAGMKSLTSAEEP